MKKLYIATRVATFLIIFMVTIWAIFMLIKINGLHDKTETVSATQVAVTSYENGYMQAIIDAVDYGPKRASEMMVQRTLQYEKELKRGTDVKSGKE